ncbi:hypothetical protein, partial [Planococcus sp. ISL-109]|uniref:hypothetical protein n=1 Tax=Planococcus sp. ISL-109 TaxID=2819166 RepID=UPI001BE4F12B
KLNQSRFISLYQSKEISKQPSAHGLAEAMRQVVFLAHSERHARPAAFCDDEKLKQLFIIHTITKLLTPK